MNSNFDYEFKNFKSRLSQFKAWENEPVSWEERWSKKSILDILERYEGGYLDEFEIFTKFLPKHLPVLEAGCGMGQLVMALSARGYQVKGIDYAAETIRRVKAVAPQLDVSVGNVYALDIPEGSLGGYISLGVFEHNPEGPLEGLREVRRALHSDGVAFISVPLLNARRKIILQRSTLAKNAILENGMRFYQFYFDIEDFEASLRRAGLKVLQIHPYALYAGLTRDFSIGRWLDGRGFIFWHIHRMVTRFCRNAPGWMSKRWAHMVMFICQRTDR